jgi:hypothetical protein
MFKIGRQFSLKIFCDRTGSVRWGRRAAKIPGMNARAPAYKIGEIPLNPLKIFYDWS